MTEGMINPWLPEPDRLIHQALGKLVEEASELAKIAARCMIQGINESDPGTGAANSEELKREIADVLACITWLSTITDCQTSNDRMSRKVNGFLKWQGLIEAATAHASDARAARMRKAGLRARDQFLDRMFEGGSVDHDMADRLEAIIDACVGAASAERAGA